MWRFYYYAGGTRVAEREATSGGETLYYLLGDHLGSTAITADSSGNKLAELRYKAWGETRYTSGATPTKRQYTGQISDSYITDGLAGQGVYWMGSRLYDSALGRFLQADTYCQVGLSGSGNSLACSVSYSDPKILEQYNYINSQPNGIVDTVQAPRVPQNLDRYAYAGNNPLKYVDESGHCFGFAGGADTAVCTFFAMAGPPGWIIDGLIILPFAP